MTSRPTTYAARFTMKMIENMSGYGTQIPKYNAKRLTPGSSFERSTIVVSSSTATDASTASRNDTSPPKALVHEAQHRANAAVYSGAKNRSKFVHSRITMRMASFALSDTPTRNPCVTSGEDGYHGIFS